MDQQRGGGMDEDVRIERLCCVIVMGGNDGKKTYFGVVGAKQRNQIKTETNIVSMIVNHR